MVDSAALERRLVYEQEAPPVLNGPVMPRSTLQTSASGVSGLPLFWLKTWFWARFLQIRLRHESRDKYVIHISKTAFKKCHFETPHYYVSIMGQQKKSRG